MKKDIVKILAIGSLLSLTSSLLHAKDIWHNGKEYTGCYEKKGNHGNSGNKPDRWKKNSKKCGGNDKVEKWGVWHDGHKGVICKKNNSNSGSALISFENACSAIDGGTSWNNYSGSCYENYGGSTIDELSSNEICSKYGTKKHSSGNGCDEK